MAKLSIKIYGEPILRERAQEIEKIEPRHKTLAADMAETMYAARGIGIAANQVGSRERIAIVDVHWAETEDEPGGAQFQPRTLINPEIVEESPDEDVYNEGCLSMPEVEGDVWRPVRIRYRYTNLEGERLEKEATGMEARCILHELDHLNGALFIDRLSPEDREKMVGKLAALRRRVQG